MSPEQFEGKAATAASDQWAFVVALYWAAYGVSPYPDGDVRDLSKSVRTEPPAEPPRVADVPAWLWPILKRGLERDPARRFPGMDALSAEIEKHVPRDPELDPTLVVRERQILSAFFCLAYLVHSAVLLHPTLARLYMQPRPLILLPSILFGVLAVGLVARRPLLARNVYGRRLTWLFPLGLGAVIAHRAVDLHLRLAAPQILIGDGFLLALLYAIVAVGDHAWLGWVSLITVAASIASAFRLDATPTILGIGGLATIGAMCVRLFVDRNMTPGAAVGALDREPMTGGGTTTAD
jgi:hypothetical protein